MQNTQQTSKKAALSETVQNSPRAFLINFIMFFTYAFFAVNWIAGSTLTPQIMEHFGLKSFASATFISNAITIAKIIGNFMAAGILVKLQPKKAIGLGSLLIVLGSAAAIVAPAYWVFILGRFVMGFGGALYVVYLSPVVIHYFTGQLRLTINSINNVAYNVGSVIAMIIVTPVIMWLKTWQYSMAFFAAISADLFFLWPIFGQNFEVAGGNDSSAEKYTMGEALKQKFNWIFPFTYSGLLTLYLVILNIFPNSGFSVIDAKTLSTLVCTGGIAGAFAAIFLGKVYSERKPVIRWCGLAMTACALLMIITKTPVVALICAFLLGFLMFLPVTSLVMIPQDMKGMTPAKLTTIMGIFWALSYIIETIAYFIIGMIIDSAGYQTALFTAVALPLTFFVGSFLLPNKGEDAC